MLSSTSSSSSFIGFSRVFSMEICLGSIFKLLYSPLYAYILLHTSIHAMLLYRVCDLLNIHTLYNTVDYDDDDDLCSCDRSYVYI